MRTRPRARGGTYGRIGLRPRLSQTSVSSTPGMSATVRIRLRATPRPSPVHSATTLVPVLPAGVKMREIGSGMTS